MSRKVSPAGSETSPPVRKFSPMEDVPDEASGGSLARWLFNKKSSATNFHRSHSLRSTVGSGSFSPANARPDRRKHGAANLSIIIPGQQLVASSSASLRIQQQQICKSLDSTPSALRRYQHYDSMGCMVAGTGSGAGCHRCHSLSLNRMNSSSGSLSPSPAMSEKRRFDVPGGQVPNRHKSFLVQAKLNSLLLLPRSVSIDHALTEQKRSDPTSERKHIEEKDIVGVQRRHSNRSRHSYHPNTSPKFSRCKSPVFHQVVESEVAHSSTTSSPPIATYRPKLHGFDTRRWSLASLPSSGYGTPGSSAFSSQYSSQERLQLFGAHQHCCGAGAHAALSSSPHQGGHQEEVLYSTSPYNTASHFGSQDSNPNMPILWDDVSTPARVTRPRSRSFNNLAWLNINAKHGSVSMARSFNDSGEVSLRNNAYKERFPKAKKQMEDKLRSFIGENQVNLSTSAQSIDDPSLLPLSSSSTTTADASHAKMSMSFNNSEQFLSASPVPRKIWTNGAARFLHNQIIELACDVLQKSDEDMLSSVYFYDMFQNLEDLLAEARDKSPDSLQCLSEMARKLLLIVSRTARLLECLEFDPDQFYRFLEEAEGHAKENAQIGQDIPQYIIKQLGLSHDVHEDDTTLESQGPGSPETGPQSLQPLSCTAGRLEPPKEDDFETLKLISNGAYGAVYLVRHVRNRRKFALKKLRKLNLALRNQIDQVYAERDILTFTDNPFVVSFYGSFETKRHLCMVMEYVEGGDCAALLKNIGVFPLDLARLYIAETVLAIEYLHSYGIVHRDLKPDNLLITALGHIKLTDFGLSKIGLMNRTNLLYEGCLDLSDTQQFQDRQICGTPEYIAPEVILMNGYGKPVDWWALGCILYEFLVGVVPFFGDTPEELFSHVISDEVQWPEDPEDPPQLARILIEQLLQQDPVDRLGTVNGAIEIKSHPFFAPLDWNSLLRQKAEFVPQLEGEDDTSYFDTRSDRYNHEVESDDDELGGISLDESVAFSSFSSCSPRFSHLTDQMQKTSDFGSSSLDSVSGSLDSTSYEGVVLRRHSTQRMSGVGSSANGKQVTPIGGQSRKASANTEAQQNQVQKTSTANVSLSKIGVCDSADAVLTHTSSHRRANTISLPRLAISMDSGEQLEQVVKPSKELSPVDEHLSHEPPQSAHATSFPPPRTTTASYLATRQVSVPNPVLLRSSPSLVPPVGSTSTSQGLHLVIPSGDLSAPPVSPPPPSSSAGSGSGSVLSGGPLKKVQSPGGSSTSSRDDSPHRRGSCVTDPNSLLPMIKHQKPPVAIRKGPKGYGFTFKTIRVYLGQSDYYTIQHIVTLVEPASPAASANLEPNDLITHVNNLAVQNMPHPQVVQLMLSSGDTMALRVSPLDQTSIQQGGQHRQSIGKMARRKGYKQKMQRKALEKKARKSSLFRRLSGKRASAELSALGMACNHALGAAVLAPAGLAPSNLTAVQRSASTCESLTVHPPGSSSASVVQKHSCGGAPVNILRAIGLSPRLTRGDSSSSSSPASSVPNSPASPFLGVGQSRPSTLHGLTSKLRSSFKSPTRRKNTQGIPLSPLARAEPSGCFAQPASSSTAGQSSASLVAPPASAPITLTEQHQAQSNPLFAQIEAAQATNATPIKCKRISPNKLSAEPSGGPPRRLSSGAQTTRCPSPLAMDNNVDVDEQMGPSLKTITRPRKSSERAPSGSGGK